MSAVRDAYREELTRLQVVPKTPRRRPLLEILGVAAARAVSRFPAARTAALVVGGFGLISAACWMVAVPLGLAAAGVSLLVLEYLTHEERRQ
jgi:hypothetical protein